MRIKKVNIAVLILTMLVGATNVALAAQDKSAPVMSIRGIASQPIGHHAFCQRYGPECAVRSQGRQRVKLSEERWQALVEVNAAVNAMIEPVTDDDLFGQPEVWTYPTQRGDCEDFVLLKRQLLIDREWPVGALLITVVRQPNGDGHAVLTVLTDRGDLVLDNLEPEIRLWTRTPYTYLKRQSEHHTGEWVAIEDGRAHAVGSLNE